MKGFRLKEITLYDSMTTFELTIQHDEDMPNGQLIAIRTMMGTILELNGVDAEPQEPREVDNREEKTLPTEEPLEFHGNNPECAGHKEEN